MERAQRRRPGIVTGRTMSSEAGTPVGLYHNVCGTLNGRSLADGSMLYGCTCNLSVDLARVDLDFDMTFTEVGGRLSTLQSGFSPVCFPGVLFDAMCGAVLLERAILNW